MAAPRIQDASPQTAPAASANLAPLVEQLRHIADVLAGEGNARALNETDESLFQALRKWRAEEARKQGMPPYIVASDRVLLAVVEKKPTTLEALREVPGFGPAKTEKYGPALVDVVAAT